MASTMYLQYCVTFGSGDSSEWIEWETQVYGEEEEAYLRAVRLRIPLEEVTELDSVLEEAEGAIREMEEENAYALGEPYVRECYGEIPMDPDDINILVECRDPHALEFFGLEELSEDELDEWDAHDLETLPMVKDFDEDFMAESPFDLGWDLQVEFGEQPEEEELTEGEAEEILAELFDLGDIEAIHDFITRCEELFSGNSYDSLAELAISMAEELGVEFSL